MITFNGEEVIKYFPNGETLLDSAKILEVVNGRDDSILCRYETDKDLFALRLLKNYLGDKGYPCILNLPYIPYSRMDRVEGNSAFTIEYVCEFINELEFYQVNVIEPHSDVSSSLLNNVVEHWVTPTLFKYARNYWGFDMERDTIFFPDAGAKKRYEGLFPDMPIIYGEKKRDFSTGRIESLEVVGNINEHATVYIIDDLCSYGGTFALAAERLEALGAKTIILIVAHCENSFNDGKLPHKYSILKVLSTDSIYTAEPPSKLTIYPCESLMKV